MISIDERETPMGRRDTDKQCDTSHEAGCTLFHISAQVAFGEAFGERVCTLYCVLKTTRGLTMISSPDIKASTGSSGND